MEQVNIIGIDLAKRSFQLHGARADGSVAFRRKVSRERLLYILGAQQRCVVAMEACASAHYWGREILKLGHDVRLVPADLREAVRESTVIPRHLATLLKMKDFLSRIRCRRECSFLQSQSNRRRTERIGRYHPRRTLAGLTGGNNTAPDQPVHCPGTDIQSCRGLRLRQFVTLLPLSFAIDRYAAVRTEGAHAHFGPGVALAGSLPSAVQERCDGAIRHEPGQFPDHLGGVGVRCYARLPSLSPTYRELGVVSQDVV